MHGEAEVAVVRVELIQGRVHDDPVIVGCRYHEAAFFNLTPGPLPFCSMKVTPAASRARPPA